VAQVRILLRLGLPAVCDELGSLSGLLSRYQDQDAVRQEAIKSVFVHTRRKCYPYSSFPFSSTPVKSTPFARYTIYRLPTSLIYAHPILASPEHPPTHVHLRAVLQSEMAAQYIQHQEQSLTHSHPLQNLISCPLFLYPSIHPFSTIHNTRR